MIRFCFKCGSPSPNWKDQKRVWRSPYCSNDCKTAAVNEKRDLRRKSKKCPTCGRNRQAEGKRIGKAISRWVDGYIPPEQNIVDAGGD